MNITIGITYEHVMFTRVCVCVKAAEETADTECPVLIAKDAVPRQTEKCVVSVKPGTSLIKLQETTHQWKIL